MSERVELGSLTKGSWRENEDSWHLVVEEDGNMHVQHRWSYENPYKGGKANQGNEELSLDQFLSGNVSTAVKQKLRDELVKRVGSGCTY